MPDVMDMPRVMKSATDGWLVLTDLDHPWQRFASKQLAECYAEWCALRKKPTVRDRIAYRMKVWAMMLGLRRRLPWR